MKGEKALKLQSIIIPQQNFEAYFRGGEINNGEICLKADETLTTDTYYNGFCYTKYRDYTTVTSVRLLLEFNGSVRVKLMCFDGEKEHCVGENDGRNPLTAELSQLPEKGILYFSVTATEDSVISGAVYTADRASDDIKTCVAICTYKREQYVLHNLELLRSYKFSHIKRVYVSDNGNTLDVEGLSDGFIRILPNRNFGGSGGFTRGMIEARNNSFSHVILMDDDVEFHPETLERMTVLVSVLKDEYKTSWISAGMIPINEPWKQYELGAEWNGSEAIVHKHNADIRSRTSLIDNLDNPDINYAGWWTLLMPVCVTERGLPYPLFIKFDDVEYGLRNAGDTEVITMNGIAVRHEAFDRKKSFVLDYYNLRNRLIVNALYGKSNAVTATNRFWREIFRNLIQYRYDNIPIILRAAKDFLNATDILLHADEEQINSELISSVPTLVPLNDITEWNDSMRCDEHITDTRLTPLMALTLGGHLIPAFALKKETIAVPLSKTGTVDCLGRRSIIQYQLGSEYGIHLHRSFTKFIKYCLLSTIVAVKLLLGHGKSKRQLITVSSELTSFDFWTRHLNL